MFIRRPAKIGMALLSLFIVFAIAVTVSAAPKITFLPPKKDLGKVPQNVKTTFIFYIVNQGDTALNISKIEGSCECTTVGIGLKKIKPGQRAPVTVTFDSTGMSGQVSKSVLVASDDPVYQIKEFSYTAVVNPGQ